MMEGFNGQNLQLVLGIKEGCHFDRVQRPTVIIATLNNNCRESRKIQPDCNPQYASELIWETNKNALRKMRCNQTPIKIECFAVNENGSKEKLGYALMGVRCAQIIYQDKESCIKTSWHDILGLKSDFNNCKPQLLLYLIIREKEIKSTSPILKEKEFFNFNIVDAGITPMWIEEEHLIQLGQHELCHDLFLLNITAVSAANFNELTQEIKENENNDYILFYNILDTAISLKPFKIDSDYIHLHEKISFKIRTSLPILTKYLTNRSHFFVKLKNKNNTISQSEINLKPLINANCMQEIKQRNKNSVTVMEYFCVFNNIYSKENQFDIKKGGVIDKLPHLKMNIKCQHIELKESLGGNNITTLFRSPLSQLETNTNSSQINKNHAHLNKCSDSEKNEVEDIKKHQTKVQSFLEKVVHFDEDFQTVSDMKNSEINSYHNSPESINIRKSYCLSIYLNTIQFFSSRPDIQNIEFRFYHPKGEILTTVCNNIPIVSNQTVTLQDVKCKLYFICTDDEIEQLLQTFVPKINVCDATFQERKCIAQVALNIDQLIYRKKLQCEYKASLIDCRNGNEIGCTDICMILEDQSPTTLEKIEEDTLNELDEWKEKQKELFYRELKEKEKDYLILLNEEWKKHRENIESKLASSIQQCKILADNLKQTTDNFKLKKLQSLEREAQLIKENEELRWKYDHKIHQLQDILKKMQEEFPNKISDLEKQNRNLISQIQTLQEEKFELEKVTVEQVEKLHSIDQVSLNEDQTTSVLKQLKNLEEKLDTTRKSKAFFKEQWSSAVKELHKIKTENQRFMECQIKSHREELENLNLEDVLLADSAALAQDRIALNKIQEEINNLKPELDTECNKEHANELMYTPCTDLCLYSTQNFMVKDLSMDSSSYDRKLNLLIEERDDLLKTGNYSSKDEIVTKLNAEIRSMLMNS